MLPAIEQETPPVISTFYFVARKAIAWFLAFMVLSIAWSILPVNEGNPPWPFYLLMFVVIAYSVVRSFSHLRRVRLVADLADPTDPSVVGNRQRRQIEIPFDADEAFDLLDAAVRELPGSEEIESARDSLQVRAKVQRAENQLPPHPTRWQRFNHRFNWLDNGRDQILATITPGNGSGSLTLICEPERDAWSDWLLVDRGANLANAEAIVRAIRRRIGERRRNEQAAAAQTATEKELTVAKLSLLHAQVEPHFLYNTLANAQHLTRTDPARADQMLGHLIHYLRHSLPSAEDTLSTLGEELERAHAYLEILKIRMGARLEVQIDVPENLASLPMPPMMLQTLVENAIKHGLEPRPGGGTIWIRARAQDDRVAITVADDGQGFGTSTQGTGIGLKNVRQRLALVYGEAASLAVVANFPNGVAATLTLPSRIPEGPRHD